MSTKVIKKSVDIPEAIHADIQKWIESNHPLTFTQIAVQGLKLWLQNPTFELTKPTTLPNRKRTKR
jgi:hypothetical protein